MVYRAKVTEQGTGKTDTYTGVTANRFNCGLAVYSICEDTASQTNTHHYNILEEAFTTYIISTGPTVNVNRINTFGVLQMSPSEVHPE